MELLLLLVEVLLLLLKRWLLLLRWVLLLLLSLLLLNRHPHRRSPNIRRSPLQQRRIRRQATSLSLSLSRPRN